MNRVTCALAVLILSLVVAGCSVQRAYVAQKARSSLVGITKSELLSCAGAPARSGSTEDMEVLTYVGDGGSTGALPCEVSFVLTNERVTKINYAGRTGGLLTKGEQCAVVVESCMQSY